MRRKYRLSLERAIALLIAIIILLLVGSIDMPINIFYPMAALCLVGSIVGLFLPSILTTWLIIFSFIIGVFMVIIGYILIPIWERTIVVIALPLMLGLSSLIKIRAGSIASAKLSKDQIIKYSNERDVTTNLWNTQEAEDFYNKCIDFLKQTKIPAAEFSATLIYWSHSEQYHQIDADETATVLKKIGQQLRNTRVPSERVFYLEEGYFLVLGSINSKIVLNKLNERSMETMEKTAFHTDESETKIQFQCSDLIITNENVDKYKDFKQLTKKLVREHEMEIIREYQ
ncbi:hypothetical protein [Ligilactobacillus cholophilus]|uniref:hypothetical protein n=1 Tax=Ligilactobacillus cholophilus TaxID=3050131 RepID=UPI0025B144AF|nr:hypothetical protein [Ligilactobacillus cholophilus]